MISTLQRQFARVFEMLLFHHLDDNDEVAVKAYRLFVRPHSSLLPPRAPLTNVRLCFLSHNRSKNDCTGSTTFVPSISSPSERQALRGPRTDPSPITLHPSPQELLSQMKPSERKVKLEETYESLVSDYLRILDRANLS